MKGRRSPGNLSHPALDFGQDVGPDLARISAHTHGWTAAGLWLDGRGRPGRPSHVGAPTKVGPGPLPRGESRPWKQGQAPQLRGKVYRLPPRLRRQLNMRLIHRFAAQPGRVVDVDDAERHGDECCPRERWLSGEQLWAARLREQPTLRAAGRNGMGTRGPLLRAVELALAGQMRHREAIAARLRSQPRSPYTERPGHEHSFVPGARSAESRLEKLDAQPTIWLPLCLSLRATVWTPVSCPFGVASVSLSCRGRGRVGRPDQAVAPIKVGPGPTFTAAPPHQEVGPGAAAGCQAYRVSGAELRGIATRWSFGRSYASREELWIISPRCIRSLSLGGSYVRSSVGGSARHGHADVDNSRRLERLLL
jgi:hypothetical protein